MTPEQFEIKEKITKDLKKIFKKYEKNNNKILLALLLASAEFSITRLNLSLEEKLKFIEFAAEKLKESIKKANK